MTPSKETTNYFLSKNIPCVATLKDSFQENGTHEHRHSHDQRFIVMDEPIPRENKTVSFKLLFIVWSARSKQ